MQFRSYAAIGDSFTEGVGDDLPDGSVRGWADLVALGLASAARTGNSATTEVPFGYANLAIRGRLLGPIIDEQLDAAISLSPDLLSLNGGGNDIMRPKVSVESVADQLAGAAESAMAAGIHVLLLSGGNPTKHIPLGARIELRGEQLAVAVRARVPSSDMITFVDNWADAELADLKYWSVDKLHLPWIGRRLTGRSSGDGRDPKRPTLMPVELP